MEYSIDIRKKRFGLPYRQYIWKGGKNPVDMPILDSNYNPEKETDGTPDKIYPYAGKDWFFAYGEQEWMNPIKKADDTFAEWNEYRDFSEADVGKRKSCQQLISC